MGDMTILLPDCFNGKKDFGNELCLNETYVYLCICIKKNLKKRATIAY
jgi:hypothetical protein